MNAPAAAYDLWGLAVANAAFFTCFAACCFRPLTRGDWPLLAAFALFVSMHFVERYGAPFSLHVLCAWLPSLAAVVDRSPHAAAHLWPLLSGETMQPHANLVYATSHALVLAGFAVLALASRALDGARRAGGLAVAGPYRWLRHPQIAALGLVTVGLLLQWPTLPTVALLGLLAAMGWRVAQADEESLHLQFGLTYAEYAGRTPAFVPDPRQLRLPATRRGCADRA